MNMETLKDQKSSNSYYKFSQPIKPIVMYPREKDSSSDEEELAANKYKPDFVLNSDGANGISLIQFRQS